MPRCGSKYGVAIFLQLCTDIMSTVVGGWRGGPFTSFPRAQTFFVDIALSSHHLLHICITRVDHEVMPVGDSGYPVLSHFLCSVEKNTGMPPQPLTDEQDREAALHAGGDTRQQLPKGVVLGPDGKPYD